MLHRHIIAVEAPYSPIRAAMSGADLAFSGRIYYTELTGGGLRRPAAGRLFSGCTGNISSQPTNPVIKWI